MPVQLGKAPISDKDLVIAAISQVPLAVTLFIATNMLSRAKIFGRLYDKLTQPSLKLPSLQGGNYHRFAQLNQLSQVELLTAIKSLQSYATNSKKSNDRRKKLFKLMSWRQQKLCQDVGYLQKLNKIDQSIASNQKILNKIADSAIDVYGLSFRDFDLLKNSSSSNVSSSNYRVVETLGHYVRDWSLSTELSPLLAYINSQLSSVIPRNHSNTCIIIPGSGLGRLAHEVAKSNDWGAVHAVEYSGLMHICNEFIYNNKSNLELFPHIHSCSNFTSTKSQFRPIAIDSNVAKPANLHLHHQDFRYFQIPNLDQFDTVVIVSAFFIDTAENLIDYFDTINHLTTPSRNNKNLKKGFWINIGPLKYGSAAQAELNSEEITKIRKKIGWNDLHHDVTLNNKESPLVGYITDKDSLWQGYYGLTRWTSARCENH
ncbi:N2227-domain-containing protein [Hyphopichia burtonii NRRL Y-1933]|uniref:N2227-domain-containing protein n=1 Tax=Hyphopichia burtonii NRRL Y-1933 TaxID=984485 RepID=A0A1E4RR68_9ASCO|nr:N2227-domain-containing protein [Hyphopichia burtonii NRRL Y-1933]ODV69780.1 N2227-domain-containing protein [Hyphopichia burtonii NRRL Y-1933]